MTTTRTPDLCETGGDREVTAAQKAACKSREEAPATWQCPGKDALAGQHVAPKRRGGSFGPGPTVQPYVRVLIAHDFDTTSQL